MSSAIIAYLACSIVLCPGRSNIHHRYPLHRYPLLSETPFHIYSPGQRPPVNRTTHACGNISFPQLRWRLVNMSNGIVSILDVSIYSQDLDQSCLLNKLSSKVSECLQNSNNGRRNSSNSIHLRPSVSLLKFIFKEVPVQI